MTSLFYKLEKNILRDNFSPIGDRMSGHGRTNPQDKKNKQLNIIQPDNVVLSGETHYSRRQILGFFSVY